MQLEEFLQTHYPATKVKIINISKLDSIYDPFNAVSNMLRNGNYRSEEKPDFGIILDDNRNPKNAIGRIAKVKVPFKSFEQNIKVIYDKNGNMKTTYGTGNSALYHMGVTIQQSAEATSGSSYCMDKNIMKYEANTKVFGENLKISIDMSDVSKSIKEHSGSKNGFSFAERIKKAKQQIDGFFGTELMQTLTRLHVAPVRSPIKKTNVILKNPNFRKAEELWNYIQSFQSKDKKEKEKRDYFDKGVLKNEYDQAFLMAFIANKNFISSSQSTNETNIIQQMIVRLIDNLLETDPLLTEDRVKDVFLKQIEMIKEKNIKRRKSIINILDNRLDREVKSIDDLLDMFKVEA